MIKFYSKKHLAKLIVEANPDIFIPLDVLIDDLDIIYKIRKVAKKVISGRDYSILYLKNLITISENTFGDKAIVLYKLILSDDELKALQSVIENESGLTLDIDIS